MLDVFFFPVTEGAAARVWQIPPSKSVRCPAPVTLPRVFYLSTVKSSPAAAGMAPR